MASLTQNWIKKRPEYAHYVPTVTERSKSIIMQRLRKAIRFSGQFLNITKS